MQVSDFQQEMMNALADAEFLESVKSIINGRVYPVKEPFKVLPDNDRELKFKRLDPRAKMPYQAEGSAGYDLFPLDPCVIPPGETAVLDVGLSMEFDDDLAAVLVDRSGLGLKGIIHRAGLLDANYRGPWKIILFNSGTELITLIPEKACVQVLFLEKIRFKYVVEVQELSNTGRGASGFGSTDKGGAV